MWCCSVYNEFATASVNCSIAVQRQNNPIPSHSPPKETMHR